MSMVTEQNIFLDDVSLLTQYAKRKGITLTYGEAYRTEEQQRLHLFNGKTKAKYSTHQERLAVDFNFFIDGSLTYSKEDIQVLGDFWESLDVKNRWGGNFKSFVDTPHFERNI